MEKTDNISLNISRVKKANEHISGALTLTLSAVILKVLGFIYKIPLSNLLGDTGMGYFNTAYTVFSIFYLLCTAGVPKAITMLVAEAEERGRGGDEKRIVKVAILSFTIIGAAISALLVLLAEDIALIIGAPKAEFTLLAIAPSIIPVALGSALRGYLSAKMKLLSIAVSQIIDGVGKLAFGLIFALYAHSLGLRAEIISAFTIFGVSIGAIASLIYLSVAYKLSKREEKAGQKQNNKPFSSLELSSRKSILKRLFSISIPITLSSLVMSLGNMIDLGMIMRRLRSTGYSEEEAAEIFGNYTTLAVPMYNFVISLIVPISIALLPAISKAFVNCNYDDANRKIRDSLSLSAFMSAPMVLGLFVFSDLVLEIIFPKSDIKLGASLLSLLIPAAAIMPILLIANSIHEARGRVSVPLIAMLIGSIVKIASGYFLISNDEIGVGGAPIGTVLSYALALFISLVFMNKDTKIKLPILSTHIIPYLNGIISILVAKNINDGYLVQENPISRLLIVILIAGSIYLILSILTGILNPKKLNIRHIKQKSEA